MADDTQQQTFRGSLASAGVKTWLAFFLVVVAASLTVYLINTLVNGAGRLDAGTIALFASFVTMFIKMASDGTGYQFSSSAGSEKKDEVQASVSQKLAEKVPTPVVVPLAPVAPAPPTTDQLGQSLLSNGELTYFNALADDEAKKSFLAMSSAERQATIAKG